jgi:putative transposase
MPRTRRREWTGVPHHVIQRGTNRTDIFRRHEDYELFLRLLATAARRYDGAVSGYALMTNHAHVVLTPIAAGSIGRMMRYAGSQYVQYFNRRYARTGTLFEGRYRMSVIDTDDYWFTCMKYIELNPVRAGVVTGPDQYCWSSHAANALGVPDRLLTPHPLYLALGTTPEQRQARWRSLCANELDLRELAAIRHAIQFGERFSDTAQFSSESSSESHTTGPL